MKSDQSSPSVSPASQSEPQDSQTTEGPAENTTTPVEIGERKGGLDPTRYGDWEKNGRCIDF